MTYFPAYPIFFKYPQLSHKARKKEGSQIFPDGHRKGKEKHLQSLVPDPSQHYATLVKHLSLYQEQGKAPGAAAQPPGHLGLALLLGPHFPPDVRWSVWRWQFQKVKVLYMSQCWSELQPCRADHFFLTQQGCMECWNASLITAGHPYAATRISHMLMSQTSVVQRDTLAKLKTLVLGLPFLFKISSRERSRRERLMLEEDMSSTHPTVKKNPSSQASLIRIDRTCILTLSRALEVPLCPFSSVSDQSSSFGPSVWAAHAGWEKGWTKGAYIAWSAPRPTGRTASCTTVLPHLNASSKNTLHPGVIWLQS